MVFRLSSCNNDYRRQERLLSNNLEPSLDITFRLPWFKRLSVSHEKSSGLQFTESPLNVLKRASQSKMQSSAHNLIIP